MLQGDGAAEALCAALLQQQLNLGQLHHSGAHRLFMPVVLVLILQTHTNKNYTQCSDLHPLKTQDIGEEKGGEEEATWLWEKVIIQNV